MSYNIQPLVLYYSDKINIYDNCYFLPLPVTSAPKPPPSAYPIFQPLGPSGTAYQTATYAPPYNNYYNTQNTQNP